MKNMRLASFPVLVFCLCNMTAAYAEEAKMSLELANEIIEGCIKMQSESEINPLNIAVVDDAGLLVSFARQDGAFKGSLKVAQMKAHSSAMFPMSTRQLKSIAFGEQGKPAGNPGVAFVPGLISFPGGLPVITASGQHIGAIGVSGASADEDEQCAQAGLDVVAGKLK